jgi:hypothetical protein
VLTVLGLVLEHSDAAKQIKLVCNLLQVSILCSRVVEQSNMQCSVILKSPPLNTVSSFAAWLARHTHLVSTLTVRPSTAHAQTEAAVEQLVGSALQIGIRSAAQAAASTCSSAVAVSPAPAARLHVLPAAQLRLESLAWTGMQGPAVLQPLSILQTLTVLKFTFANSTCYTASMLAATGRLKSLRELYLDAPQVDATALPWSAHLRQLSCLTRLVFFGIIHGADCLPDLPVTLKTLGVSLKASVGQIAAGLPQPMLLLDRLADLRQLRCTWHGPVVDAVLPKKLAAVSLFGRIKATLPASVCDVHLDGLSSDPGLLEQLQHLPLLARLQFVLPYDSETGPMPLAGLQGMVSALGAATQLRDLTVLRSIHDVDITLNTRLQFGAALRRLEGLQTLNVYRLRLCEADAMSFSCLTGLTNLDVSGGGQGVNDMVAVALGCKLTGLRLLRLRHCGLQTQVALAALGTLSQLTTLDLALNTFVLTQSGCLALSGLTELRELGLPPLQRGREAWTRFKASLVHLQACERA